MFDKICKMKNIILFKYEILYFLVMILYNYILALFFLQLIKKFTLRIMD